MNGSFDNIKLENLFPRFISHVNKRKSVFDLNVLPRRIRNTTPNGDDPLIFQSCLNLSTTRTRRLLASPDELRRESGDSIKLGYDSFSDGMYNPSSEEKSEEELRHSHRRAQCTPVIENTTTGEFLCYRDNPHWESNDFKSWGYYNNIRVMRHHTSEYCRSNLDWTWDTACSLKHLFRIDKPKTTPRSESEAQLPLSATLDLADSDIGINRNNLTLGVTIPRSGIDTGLLGKVRIRFQSESGEVRYKTFYAGPSGDEEATFGAGLGIMTRTSFVQEAGESVSHVSVKGH